MKELIDLLTTQLKIDPKQATGGAAILFKAAQDKLGGAQFGKLLGGLASALGGGNAAVIASIVTGFGKLGLTQQHAQQFVPVILEFLRGKVGKDVVATLEKTLRG